MSALSADAVLHSWFSPAYPIGAFAYSHGLEQAILAGEVTTADALRDWLAAQLRFGAARSDAVLLSLAWREIETVDDLAALAEALAASAERHQETMAQGAAFARVTRDVHGVAVPDAAYPVAVGVAAQRMALPLEAALRFYLNAYVANLVSAAVRFMPLGQTAGQQVVAGLFPVVEAAVAEALTATCDDVGTFVPSADLSAIEHETLQVRIFRT